MYKILIIALKCYFNNKCIQKEKIQKVLLVKYISTSVFFIIANSAQQITIHINVLLIAQILII